MLCYAKMFWPKNVKQLQEQFHYCCCFTFFSHDCTYFIDDPSNRQYEFSLWITVQTRCMNFADMNKVTHQHSLISNLSLICLCLQTFNNLEHSRYLDILQSRKNYWPKMILLKTDLYFLSRKPAHDKNQQSILGPK